MGLDEYYYDAEGSQVTLKRDDDLAVEIDAATASGREILEARGQPLRGDIVLIRSDLLPAAVADELDNAGAIHPVFRTDDRTRVIVLPEIRIEAANEAQLGEILKKLDAADIDSKVVRRSGATLVVQPSSGRGADALHLANEIHEQVHPPMVQARFVRLMRRPGVQPVSSKKSEAPKSTKRSRSSK